MDYWTSKQTILSVNTRLRVLTGCLLLVVSAAVSAESRASLPDFYNEARIVFQGMCDGGKISYGTFYKQGSYVIEEARIVPGGFFYFMKRYRGKQEGWEERYFKKLNDSAKLLELAHEEWDEDIKLASVNYFNKLHDLPTTCTKLLVS